MSHANELPGAGAGAPPLRQGRPLEAVALAALLAGAAACLLAGIAFPMSRAAPVHVGAVLLAVAVAMAGGTLALARRMPRWALVAEAVLAALLNSVLVARSHTTGGAMADALAYLWLTAWVALFFSRWAVGFAVAVALGFGGGLLAAGLPRMTAPWLLVSVATLMIGVLVGRFSRAMRRHLRTDPLTGVLNRSGLAELAGRLPRRRRQDGDIVVAALDLDDFKQVNDRDGHAAGDRLLADATAAWRGALRSDDVLARTGGDEFVLVMPGVSAEEAARVLERVRCAHPVAWSAGLTRWRADESLERCLERADSRLYAAKAGRDGAQR